MRLSVLKPSSVNETSDNAAMSLALFLASDALAYAAAFVGGCCFGSHVCLAFDAVLDLLENLEIRVVRRYQSSLSVAMWSEFLARRSDDGRRVDLRLDASAMQ